MTENNGPVQLPRRVITPEQALEYFDGNIPTSGRVNVQYKNLDDAHATDAAMAKAEQANLAEAAAQRPPTANEKTTSDSGKKFSKRKALVGLLVGAVVFGPSGYEAFHENTELSPQIILEDSFMSVAAFPINDYNFGIRLGGWIDRWWSDIKNNYQNNTPAAMVATATITASATPKPTNTSIDSQSPTPSPSALNKLAELPKAKDLASIQTPQPQPFNYEYSKDKDGDIKGFNGYYKASSGITIEEVQWIESCGNITDNVLLTFEDTGSEEHIRAIANVLKQQNVGALFVLNTKSSPDGGAIAPSQSLLDDLRNDGFGVANHSKNHRNMTKLTDAEIREEIVGGGPSNLVRLLFAGTNTNQENDKTYVDDRLLKVAKEAGAAVCGFSGEARDYAKDATAESILANIKKGLRKGANFSLRVHDNNPTLKTLPAIITLIKSEGYTLCPLAGAPTSADFSETKVCLPTKQ